MSRVVLAAILVGLILRVVSCSHHQLPRGDVVLDVGVARSLAAGEGFRSGFVRGVPVLLGSQSAVPPQGWADQHPPLWPLVGAALSFITGDAFSALKLGSWLAGVLLLLLVWRCGERLTEGTGPPASGFGAGAAGLLALTFVMVDAAGNGSLYSAQAVLVLALIEVLAAQRRPVWSTALPAGLILGAAALLNHQALVLAPVPLLTGLVCARRGERSAAWATGLGALVVAALCLAPWWWRNLLLFGDANHSVNGAYLLYRAGVQPHFLLEPGGAVIRLMEQLSPAELARSMVGFLRGNLVYLASLGPWLLPGLGGLLLVGLPGLLVAAPRRRDPRLTALLWCLLLLTGVTLLWPAAKLRYAVTLTPLLVLLAVRVAAARPQPGSGRWGLGLVLLWLALLAATLDDVTGGALDPRPERWWVLALGGGLLLLLPMVCWLRRWLSGSGLLASAMALALVASLIVLGSGPGTSYHSAPFAADAFGQHVEIERDASWRALARARQLALEDGAQTVLGPIELLVWPEPGLIELPRGAGREILQGAITSLLDRGLGDHLLLSCSDAVALQPGLELRPGQRWLGGRLEVQAIIPGGGAGPPAVGAQCLSRIRAR